jgi:AraC-like DNA-binding protein
MFWGDIVKITNSNIIETHKHNMYELVICLSDNGQHIIDGRHYNFKKGRIFFLPELISHRVTVKKDEITKIAFICFDLHTDIEQLIPSIRKIITNLKKHKHYASLNDDLNIQNLGLVKDIFRELNSHTPLKETMIGALLSQVIINLSRTLNREIEPKESNYSAKIAHICNFITTNPTIEFPLDEVAKRAGMSRALFSRNFREHTGMSLVEFILSVRISNAIKLLSTKNKSIDEISLECGFKNLGYFYRIFKRHTNSTPRKLRQYVIKTGKMPLT